MGDKLEPSTQNIGYFNLEASTVDQVFFLFFLCCSSMFLIILYVYLIWFCKDKEVQQMDAEKQIVRFKRKEKND
jgi:hypothetical protein